MSGLHEAAEKGDLVRAREQLESDHGLVTAADAVGETPLHIASLHGHRAIVEMLLAASAEVNARDLAGQTPLHYAATGEIAALLLANGAKVGAADNKGRTPLHRAAKNRQEAVIGFLLASAADVRATESEYGWTPLHYAASGQAAELLIANGADVNARDSKDRTPLHRAAENGYVDVVDVLVKRGADVNGKDNEGWTALHYAARWHGNPEMVTILLKHGADVTAVNRFGMTAGHLAAWHGYRDVARLLRKSGE